MSSSEIADNKWEVEASKPPVTNAGAISQIVLIGTLTLFFAYILVMSAVGLFSGPSENSLEEQYKNLNKAPAAEAAPAE